MHLHVSQFTTFSRVLRTILSPSAHPDRCAILRSMGAAMFCLWLTEFSGAVLSCFTLSRYTFVTEGPHIQPESSPIALFKTRVYSRSWVKKLDCYSGWVQIRETDYFFVVVVVFSFYSSPSSFLFELIWQLRSTLICFFFRCLTHRECSTQRCLLTS